MTSDEFADLLYQELPSLFPADADFVLEGSNITVTLYAAGDPGTTPVVTSRDVTRRFVITVRG